jgi:hypothetical protein
MPLFRSTRAAKSSNVSGLSALIVKSDMPATYPRLRTFCVRQLTLPGRRTRRRAEKHGRHAELDDPTRPAWFSTSGARTGTLIGCQIRALLQTRRQQASILSHISWRTCVADLLADHS